MSVAENFERIKTMLEQIVVIAERNEESEMTDVEIFLNDLVLGDVESALAKIRQPHANYELHRRKR